MQARDTQAAEQTLAMAAVEETAAQRLLAQQDAEATSLEALAASQRLVERLQGELSESRARASALAEEGEASGKMLHYLSHELKLVQAKYLRCTRSAIISFLFLGPDVQCLWCTRAPAVLVASSFVRASALSLSRALCMHVCMYMCVCVCVCVCIQFRFACCRRLSLCRVAFPVHVALTPCNGPQRA